MGVEAADRGHLGRRILAVVLGLGLSGPALACGQSTHVWVGVHALEHLPPGPLADLLTDDALRDPLINGSMFPDGGYSPLTQAGYGETAHWPPFQTRMLEHLSVEGPPDVSDPEVAAQVAFLFGMAAHGMADQVFDGLYLTLSQQIEPEAWAVGDPVDQATDVAMADAVGPQPVVDDAVPYDLLVDLFDAHGQPTDDGVMRTGQASLRVAVTWVGGTSSDPDLAREWLEMYPWANGHLLDETVPGSPACLGEVVAAHWATMWDRMHGDFDLDRDLLMTTWPPDGALGHPTDATDLGIRISLALSRALDQDSLDGRVHLRDPDGTEVPVDAGLYYGDDSNVINVWPLEDLAEDTAYEVVLDAGLVTHDGEVTTVPLSFTLSTAPPPLADVSDGETSEGCGCVQGGAGGSALGLGLIALVGLGRRRGGAEGAA